MVRFVVEARCGAARRGRLHTPHGEVRTPAFMPVATQGAVKTLTHRQVREVGTEILLSNTYHLMVRPGAERIGAAGGLHRFIGWDGPLLTDSGGFQVASLAALRTVDDDGVVFRSHLDGSLHRLTPERAVAIQELFGSDIAMVLDECVAYPMTRAVAERAAERSLRWARRSLEARRRSETALFGIVQGGVYDDLRGRNAEALVALGLDGYAIGGLALGEPKERTFALTALAAAILPEDKPRYLMGVGTPLDLVEAVARGIDLFDCVLPTRNARRGTLFTSRGRINIKNARNRDDDGPLDPDCRCYTCRTASRAYLRHLFLAREPTAATLHTIHNLSFYLELMARLRRAIETGSLDALAGELRRRWAEPVA